MRRALRGVFALAVASVTVSVPAFAHHSAAVAYDINRTISVKGVISEGFRRFRGA